MSTSLKQARDGRLLHLTLARPEKRNALNVELCRALSSALDGAGDDPSIGAILLDAEGPGFCAGMDLQEVLEPGAAEAGPVHRSLFTVGSRLRKPLVAAVHGAALAGGTGLAANAHVVFAATNATFGLTELRIGLWPYVIFRAVVEAAGHRRAVELSLTARTFGANEARDYGIVHFVTEPDVLGARAYAMAGELAAAAPEALARGLEFARQARSMDAEPALDLALERRAENFASAEFAEGVRAFRGKRAPKWPSLR